MSFLGATLPFPLEVRETIYSHIRRSFPSRSAFAALVRTSKITYKETIPYLYQYITFSGTTSPLITYGLQTELSTWEGMIQGRKSGAWFRDFDLGRYEPYILSRGTKSEIRKLILLSLVRCIRIEDEGGLKALGSIICYYQRPSTETEEDQPDSGPKPNNVFKRLEKLCLSSSAVQAMCTIISDERRYIHGRRRAHRALFDHIVPGISPTHLCLESYLWWDHFYRSDLLVRRWYGQLVKFLFHYLSRHWTLDSISMHRLAGYEEITQIFSARRAGSHCTSNRQEWSSRMVLLPIGNPFSLKHLGQADESLSERL
ncbi:hypothetical protein I316_04495 [Kwoniella heveanensis BCC8398]|uniref:Uncharacterized protein n=1 Tax=Kwoniella heveanensis BCC8398 TaxID=1296120 RepID=A0A1B9GRY7_9TREE|nr:hypothetical protein I316_04495 [Kwoniella heveanensis BCC8398]